MTLFLNRWTKESYFEVVREASWDSGASHLKSKFLSSTVQPHGNLLYRGSHSSSWQRQPSDAREVSGRYWRSLLPISGKLPDFVRITQDYMVPVVLADGSRGKSPAGWAKVFYQDRQAFTLVLFGAETGLALLGAHALEGLGLAADPVRNVLELTRSPLA